MTFSKEKMIPLKAVMALLIVADHLTFFLDSLWLKPFRELGAPIVSVFLFISGYGLSKSFQAKGQAYLDSFFKKRILKVFLPLIVALALYWIVVAIPGRSFWSELWTMVLKGTPILPFSWFAPVIIYFYLAFYVVFRFVSPRWRNTGLVLPALLLMGLVILAGYDRCWWICSFSLPTGAVFATEDQRIFRICEKSLGHYLSVILVPSILFIILYLSGNPYMWTLCYICIPLIVALLVARIPIDRLNGSVLAFLSMISYEIYLCQGIAMELFRGKMWIESDGLFILAVYAVTILVAFLVHQVSTLIHQKICASSIT